MFYQENKKYNKSFSVAPANARRTLVLKLDITPKFTYFYPQSGVKTANVATQTYTSNLLGCSPIIVKQNSV